MKILIRAGLIMCLALVLSACGSNYRSVTQQADDGAYIRLSGNFIGTELVINEQPPISIREGSTRTFRLDNERVALFEVTPGPQRVLITRDGSTLINRELYIGRGNTIAIRVP